MVMILWWGSGRGGGRARMDSGGVALGQQGFLLALHIITGGRMHLAHLAGLDPALDAVGVTEMGALAEGIQQYHGSWLVLDVGKHHQAAAGFVDESGLADGDVPALGPDQW